VQFTKSPAELVDLFDSVLPEGDVVERRQMFGYPCAFVNGNMFTGLFRDSMFVRLSEAPRAELLAVDGADVFAPMAGRPMKEYVVLPDSILSDASALRTGVARSLESTASLPPKERKPRARARKTSARRG